MRRCNRSGREWRRRWSGGTLQACLGVLALGLILGVASPAQAKVDADRIGKLVDKGKLGKAAELCRERLAEGPVEDSALVEACGDAELKWLTEDPAASPAPDALRALCRDWQGSPAAGEAWELLGRILVDDETDSEALDALAREFVGTEAGADAARRVFEGVIFARDLAGVQGWIAAHPDSPHLESAGALEAELAWERAEAADTVAAWRELMEGWPEHPRRAEAAVALREARFREAAEASPAEMIALAEQYPDDERSAELVQRAWLGAVKVEAVLEEGEPQVLPCSFDRGLQPQMLEGPLRAIRIASKEGFAPAIVEIELLRGGNLSSVNTLEIEIAASGLPSSLVDAMTLLPERWVGIEGDGEFASPGWLCRPDDAGVSSVVKLETRGGEFFCPFHPTQSCDEAAAALVQAVVLNPRGRDLILGGSRAEARQRVPGLEERDPDTLCDAKGLCLHFLWDRLTKVETSCWGPECWDEGQINQEALDWMAAWERETPTELGVDERGKNKTVWRAGVGVFMKRQTSWSGEWGRSESAWVAHKGLLCAAKALGLEQLGEDVPLTCP